MARVGIAEDRRSSTLYETDEWVGVEDEVKGEAEVAKAVEGLQAVIAAGERAEIGDAAKKLGAAANVILGAHHSVPPVRGHPLPGPRHRLA